MVTFEDNHASRGGGALNLNVNVTVSFTKNSTVKFIKNSAKFNDTQEKYGGAVGCVHCDLLFDGYSNVMFSINNAQYGGAIYSDRFSGIRFDGNSTVIFNSNVARKYGGAVTSYDHSNIIFNGKSTVKFSNNKAVLFGGAVVSRILSEVLFQGSTNVIFEDNNAFTGGAMSCLSSSEIMYREATNVLFMNNSAISGGAAHYSRNSSVSFTGNVTVAFMNNYATKNGGALLLNDYLNARLTEHSNVKFIDNRARDGSAMNCYDYCDVFFHGNSKVTFSNNRAQRIGIVYIESHSSISFDGKCKVTFTANTGGFAGAIVASSHCGVIFYGNSVVMFNNNNATHGGALWCEHYSNILFSGNANVTFNSNCASGHGAAINSVDSSSVKFNGNTTVTFEGNSAGERGGAIISENNCSLVFNGDSKVNFSGNDAKLGGVLFSLGDTHMIFAGNTMVLFEANIANEIGGSINCETNYNMMFDRNSSVIFDGNKASNGGAMFINTHSRLLFADSSNIQFINNKAIEGGAINGQQSNIECAKNSLVRFAYNSATRNGGGIHLINNFTMTFENECDVEFYHNNASRFGGAIYGELKQTNQSKILSNSTSIDFSENTALIGDNFYVQLESSCDVTCLNNIVGLNVTHNHPPHHLALYNPATCTNATNNSSRCQNYFISNIMLGQNIKINACVLSAFNKPAEGVNFVVTRESQTHQFDGTQFVPIACTLFEGISVVGTKISDKTNFSMSITSFTNSEVEISVGLIAELSPCHHGFHYDNSTQKCECYDDSDIVSCSGSTSTIKRGYWFGIVDGKATVTVCPNTYCNFTCCDTSNGFYQLSPVRTDQCSSHRSGTACGSCEEGYALSFDSANCVSINKCTAGQTALVIILTIIYWIVLVVVVFVVTYYHVEIGYFYVITYYYSMLDILLDQNLYVSQELFTVVSIMSSAAKVTPQFLGQLCFVKNMSGIDQQVIHYIHPVAVTIIVGIISQSARMSYRFSAFVSRGIIRMICFLLLLSYTSVATTSLLLLRSLKFHTVDKVYTYRENNFARTMLLH